MILIAKKGDHHYGKYIRVLKKLANCNFECQITNIFPYLFGFPLFFGIICGQKDL